EHSSRFWFPLYPCSWWSESCAAEVSQQGGNELAVTGSRRTIFGTRATVKGRGSCFKTARRQTEEEGKERKSLRFCEEDVKLFLETEACCHSAETTAEESPPPPPPGCGQTGSQDASFEGSVSLRLPEVTLQAAFCSDPACSSGQMCRNLTPRHRNTEFL
ncbi:hypothetical protein GOODEAATRI_010137, partial [Goodea atripinnis]